MGGFFPLFTRNSILHLRHISFTRQNFFTRALPGGCARCNGKAKSGEALDECLCLHAEENALLEAGRERVGDGDGAVLYCNT